MREVAVMTDSVSYMSEVISSKYSIKQIPVHIIIDGKTYLENQLDLAEFYSKMPKWKEQNKLPTTSSPSPDDFIKIYRELSKEHNSILYVGYSKHLGMTVQSALSVSPRSLPFCLEQANFKPVHSLMLPSHLFFCLPGFRFSL